MATRPGLAVVFVEVLDVDYGLWCNACMLTTGARLRYTTTTTVRGTRTTPTASETVLGSQLFCTDCDSRHITET